MLLAVGGERQPLDVAGGGQRDHHLLVGDHVLDIDLALGEGDLGAALVAVLLGQLAELLADDPVDQALVAEDLAQRLDLRHQLGVLLADLVRLEAGEALQAHVEDRLGLDLGQPELIDEAGAGDVRIGRGADQRDHGVEVVERDEDALEHVGAGLGLAQLVLRAAGDDLALVADVVADQVAQRQRLRDVVDEGDGVDAERRLHRRVLVELVERDLRHRVALALDHQAHAGAIGLVAEVGDLGDLLVADEVGDLLDQAALATLLDLEGELGDDDRLLASLERLDVGARADADAAAAGAERFADPVGAHDQAAAREVRALDVLHQPVGVDVGVVEEGVDGGADLAQVVRRDVRCHADGDPGGAVDEQVREPRRQHQRLGAGLVVVGTEVDGLGLDVAEHLGGEPGEPGLRVPHRGGGVVVDRAEVALAVDERVAEAELLRHADERVVDRGVAVRVVLAHDLADDVGALAVRPRRLQAEVVHRVEHAPVHGLEPVADVGQRAPDDHAHRVIEVRRPHLGRQLALLDVAPG